MKRPIVWLLSAEADLIALHERYLDTPFLAQINEDLDRALRHASNYPLIGKAVTPHIRRLLLAKGNYGLYYQVQKDRLLIHAILDLRRSPRDIKRRLA